MKKLALIAITILYTFRLASQIPTANLVAYWPFNGNGNDYSGNSNNGSVNGPTLTTDRFGNANSAYSFDGIDDQIVITNNSTIDMTNSTNFSVTFWLKTYSNPNLNATIMSKNTYGLQSGYMFFSNNTNSGYCTTPGQLSFYTAASGGGDACANNAIATGTYLNTWIFITGVFDASLNQASLYVNGVLQNDIGSVSLSGNLSTATSLFFGSSPTNSGYFKGALDDIRIYKTKLTQAQITNILNECSPAPLTNVTLFSNQTVCANQGTTTLNVNGGSSVNWYSSLTSTIAIASGPAFLTPLLPVGTYTYYAQDASCSTFTGSLNRVAVTVTSNALPSISVNNGTVCSGQSFTIIPSGAITYSFSGGSAVVSPSITSTYTVTGADINGCKNSAMSLVNVTSSLVLTISGNGSICKGSSTSLLVSGNALTYVWSNGVNGNLVSVSPTVSTTYNVIGTDANNCTALGSKIVIVNALPQVIAHANDSLVCAGSQVIVYGSGAVSYLWTGGVSNSIPFSPVVSSGYTVTGTDGNGCQNTDFIHLTVSALPVITVQGSANLICAGETITLTSQGANTYSWNNGSSGSLIMVNPVITTTYIVTGTDSYGCSDKATITELVDACTGIKQVAANKETTLYPNPTTGEFVIETSQERDVIITNALGQTVLKQHLSEGENTINLVKQISGIYFVRFNENSDLKTIKLIKQ